MVRAATLVLVGIVLSACTYERNGPVAHHFRDVKSEQPRGNRITVCHGYGCQNQTRVRFSGGDIAKISKIMRKTKRKDSPHEERRAVAYAVAWLETEIGRRVGTSNDRPGMDYAGSGDPGQLDCVDEATNTTSYLMLMAHNGLLKHHTVGTPFSKGNVLIGGVSQWPHWTAVLTEKEGGQRYAVDSWIHENGENPSVVKAEKWYIDDLDNLPAPTV
ncbi:MAG: hypothetical protein AAGJ70_00820 [Pseudomonadota bacterium]